ncbi:MAG: TlpA family protein disulfide reductase [Tannerella sp.]|jgi:peroxiredoxin|nr:TlpA family protein disulfide reductase [Tannerella sp.]
MKKVMIWGMLLFFLLCTAGCSKENDDKENEDPKEADIQVGDPIPNFSVDLKSGEKVTNQSLKGKISVIYFFSITCPDCKEQFPIIERVYNEYKENSYFTLVGISRAEGASVVDKFFEENNYTLPYSAQETRDVYSLFAPKIVPRIYISDADGIVKNIFLDDPIASYEDLIKILDALLEELCCKA